MAEPVLTCRGVHGMAPCSSRRGTDGRIVIGGEDEFFSLVKGDEWNYCEAIVIKRDDGVPAKCYLIAGLGACNMTSFDLRRPNKVFRRTLNRGDGTLCWFSPSFPEGDMSKTKLKAVRAPGINDFDATFSVCRHCLELLDECVEKPEGFHRVYLLVCVGHVSATLGICCLDDVRRIREKVYYFLCEGYSVIGMHFVRFEPSVHWLQ